MSVIETLITDRTQADVAYAAYLNAKVWEEFTAEEINDWRSGLKGTYNFTDLNRIGEAVLYIASRLDTAGYHVSVSPRTDFDEDTIEPPNEIEAQLSAVRALRNVIAIPSSTAALPADMDRLKWDEANAIENLLKVIDEYLSNLMEEYFHCGQITCGQIWEEFT